MADQFKRDDTAPGGIAEPLASLAAFLSDIEEQIQLFQAQRGPDEFQDVILDGLRQRVTALAMLVLMRAR